MMEKIVVLFSLLVYYQVIKAELSNEAMVALDQQYGDYSQIYDRSNKVSMYVSDIVQNMTKELYHASDVLIQNAAELKRALIVLSQKKHSKGVAETKCVEALNVDGAIKKLEKDVDNSTVCFHQEANKGPKLEDEVTQGMLDLRRRMMDGRKNCTKEEKSFDSCISKERSELQKHETALFKDLKYTIDKAEILQEKMDRRIFRCELLVSRSLKLIGAVKEKVENC